MNIPGCLRNPLNVIVLLLLLPCCGFGNSSLLASTVINSPSTATCGMHSFIFDNSCTSSNNFQVNVSGVSGTQMGTDVILQEVRFIIEHTWDRDLDIWLYSPSGVGVELSTDNGGGADNYGDPSDVTCSSYTTLSMNACLSVTEGIAPFIGTYLPEGNFIDFNNGTNPNGTWIFQVCDDAGGDVGYLEFVELVFGEMSCSPPQQLVADTLADSFVEINWSGDNSCLNTIIEYGSTGFLPGTGSTAGTGSIIQLACPTSQSVMINGLSQLTEYDVYIREQCNNGGFSQNSCPLTFTTDCSTAPLSLKEDFDAQITCSTSCGTDCTITGTWTNSTDDNFDWIIDANGTGSSNTGPSDDVSGGGNYIYLETSGSACRDGNEAVLQSQCMLVNSALGACHLSFYYHMFGNHINELSLEVSTDGAQTWASLWSLQGAQGDQWWRQYIDLSAYHNQVATFRFVGKGGDGIRGDIALDEIEFFGTNVFTGASLIYYADVDMDGFGDPDDSTFFCSYLPPVGYVDNNNDCDDTDANVSPLGIEIACNSIDENCDGFLETALPSPLINDTSVCQGTDLVLTINAPTNGTYYWFDATGNFLFDGNNFETGLVNDTTLYYVMDSVSMGCSSPLVSVVVNTFLRPSITVISEPEICMTESYDLSSMIIDDANNANGVISFHTGTPAVALNQLSDPTVTPTANTIYYVRSLTSNGCVDETAVEVIVNPLPTATIVPTEGYIEICADDVLNVMVDEAGTGTAPMSYMWDDGSTNQQRLLLPSGMPGITPYSVTVTDAEGCTDEAGVILNTLQSVTQVSIDNVTDVSFCEGNDGSISLTPINGDPPFNYQWEGPVSGVAANINGTFTIAGLTQGIYKVTITDDSNLACDIVIPVIIVNGPGAVVDSVINIVPATCFGTNDGAIDITVDGTSPSYIWSNGATTEDLIGVVAGNYSVTVIDGVCNTILDNIFIPEPTDLTLNVNAFANASCHGSADAWIDINASGGQSPYTYAWSHGAADEDVSNLIAGTYSLSITDANGCEAILNNIQISEPVDYNLGLDSLQVVSCFGEAEGGVYISVEGSTAPYDYEWNNGVETEDLESVIAGSYWLTISDVNNCTFVTDIFLVTEPEPLEVSVTNLVAPTCNQIFDGQISVFISGGTVPYTFEWSNGATTQNIADLPPGVYGLTVTDANDCTVVLSQTPLLAPTLLFLDIDDLENESCEGLSNGLIDVSVTGGTGPYNFQWSNGGSSQNISNLPAGHYTVTVTDNNGCDLVSDSVEILALEPLDFSLDAYTNVSCAGQEDGAIYISVPSGAGPYTYAWNTGDNTQDIIDLEPGMYISTITAANGCIFYTDSFYIVEPDLLDIEVVAVESPTCNGLFDGNIDVTIAGGTVPYFYSWNNGDYTEDLYAAAAGNYNVVVLDANGCITSSGNFNLPEPEALDISIVNIDDIGCVDSIGNIDIEVTGGVGSYIYQWDTGDTLQDVYNVASGFYSVSVLDQNNCLALMSSIEVEQLADTIEVLNITVMDVSCNGMADGEVHIEVVGGNYPFQYTWSNGVGDSLNTNLSGNTYNVTVTDNYGCVGISTQVELTEPPLLSYQITQITPNYCNGEMNGAITVVANGGVEPYTYLWNTGATTNAIDQLPTGNYSFTITDANGCTTSTLQDIVINDPGSSIEIELLDIDHVSCNGLNDGSIDLMAVGGTGGYTFSWSDGNTGPILENIEAGSYQCTVTDVNGCSTVSALYFVNQPVGVLQVEADSTLVNNNIFCDGSDGAIDIAVTGGTMPYSYFWNEGSLTQDIDGLESGSYLCLVIDAQGCTVYSDTFQIYEPINTLYSTPYSTPDTNDLEVGTATVDVEGGQWPFEFIWDANTNFQMDSIATNLSSAWYYVTITDALNCTNVGTVFVDTVQVGTSSINHKVNEGKLTYYPNPTSGDFWASVTLESEATIEVSIESPIGEELFVDNTASPLKESSFYFDLSNLPPGVYLLRYKIDDSYQYVRKFVVIR